MSARLRISWPQAMGASLLAWTVLVALHAMAGHADDLRRGGNGTFLDLLMWLAPFYMPWVFFTAVLLRVFSERADRLTKPAVVAQLFVASVVLFLIPQVAYQVFLSVTLNGRPGTTFWNLLPRWPATSWLIDGGFLALTFATVYAFVVIQEHRLAQQSRQRAESENMALKFEVEQHRLRALRGQLEPHFMFNALNAISGLVRGDDKAVALSALQQLSTLLRYALTASSRDWVTLGEELAFVQGYVALQHLRFGDRLRFTVQGDDEDTRSADCPPLLLQPLIENAIRHDLEGHEEESDIRLALARLGEVLTIEVTNSVRPGVRPNPGVGLGLQGTRDRLSILYGQEAKFRAEPAEGRFTVTVRFPALRPDQEDSPPL